jgi:hypothetical protein
MDILFTKVQLNVTPCLLNDLSQFLDSLSNYYISIELKSYRPARKPITTPLSDIPNPQEIRKRKLIVRDWFFFVVWSNRVKSLFKTAAKQQKEKQENIQALAK